MVVPVVKYGHENWTLKKACESHSVLSYFLWPHGLSSPWNSSGQNTGVGSCSFSTGFFQPRDQTQFSCITSWFLTSWATRKAQECLAAKTWCFWTMVLEKTLEGPLDCKEIQPVHPKGDQSWVFIGRSDVGTETPILWWLDVKNWLIGKDPDAGKDWRQVEKGMTEDEMVGWHHSLNGHEFE